MKNRNHRPVAAVLFCLAALLWSTAASCNAYRAAVKLSSDAAEVVHQADVYVGKQGTQGSMTPAEVKSSFDVFEKIDQANGVYLDQSNKIHAAYVQCKQANPNGTCSEKDGLVAAAQIFLDSAQDRTVLSGLQIKNAGAQQTVSGYASKIAGLITTAMNAIKIAKE